MKKEFFYVDLRVVLGLDFITSLIVMLIIFNYTDLDEHIVIQIFIYLMVVFVVNIFFSKLRKRGEMQLINNRILFQLKCLEINIHIETIKDIEFYTIYLFGSRYAVLSINYGNKMKKIKIVTLIRKDNDVMNLAIWQMYNYCIKFKSGIKLGKGDL